MNGLKTEDDVKIKAEASTPTALPDDEEDEDTGELQFPKTTPGGWLTRIPKDLWDSLEKLKDDDEVHIGDIKVWNLPDNKTKLRLVLNKDLEGFEMTAKEYDLQIQSGTPKNTFVFSEKNMPGWKPHYNGRGRYNRQQAQDPLKKAESVDGGSKVQKTYKRGPRTIPKHTSFAALPDHEVHCSPRENEEWHRLQAKKQAIADAARREVLLQPSLPMHEVANIGGYNRDAQNFIRTGEVKKHRPQENKAARISEGELLDMLANLFKEFKFWPLKRLKERTRQPEAFLREQLQQIAILVKQGPAANTWTLKPQMAATINMGDSDLMDYTPDEADFKQEDIAPVLSGADVDSADDDDDDDQEMEDVV